MSRVLPSPCRVLLLAAALALPFPVQSAPAFSNYYAAHPREWFVSGVSETEYFDTNLTRSWVTNETCDDSGVFTLASYNIFHNVDFTEDFGDEMEGSLGEVTRCADVVLFQEAWDYDDMLDDGPRSDMAARGFQLVLPPGHYCNGDWGVEKDCSGLVMFSKTGTTLVKDLGLQTYDYLYGPDGAKGKGIWGAIFSKEGRFYYVFNTHLDYGFAGHLEAFGEAYANSDNSRRHNMFQALDFVKRKLDENRASFPPAAVLFGGDFNADFDSNTHSSRGHELLASTGALGSFFEPAEYRFQMGAQMDELAQVPGFKSNWVGTAVDQGPNAMASGNSGDYDVILLGRPQDFDTCNPIVRNYSGWAPVWRTLDSGQRIWPSYTHSDHYGRWIRVEPRCSGIKGWVDGMSARWGVSGWTFDADVSSQSIPVHAYFDGPPGVGAWGGAFSANQVRDDVNAAFGISGQHGFQVPVPAHYYDGQAHSVFLYALDAQGISHAEVPSSRSFRFNGAEGHVEPITTDGVVPGWAYDVQAPGTSIAVDVYIDGPAGLGTYMGRYPTSSSRPDVNTRWGLTGNHGFRIPIPYEYYGDSHALYVYALDVDGRHNPLLDGKPYLFTIGEYQDPCESKPWSCGQ